MHNKYAGKFIEILNENRRETERDSQYNWMKINEI